MNHHRAILFGVGLVLVSILGGRVASADPHVAVVDEEGQPVADFEIMLNTARAGNSKWMKGGEGLADSLKKLEKSPAITVLVRAAGYANTAIEFSGDQRAALADGTASVTLQRGEPVELRLEMPEGVAWPDEKKPEVYFADVRQKAHVMRQPSNRARYEPGAPELDYNMSLESAGPGEFKLQLTNDSPPFFVAINEPGLLRLFEAGPFKMDDVKEGVLTVAVPKPVKLRVEFQPGDDAESSPIASANLMIVRSASPGSGAYVLVATKSSEEPKVAFKAADLAPGEYQYLLSTKPKDDIENLPDSKINPGKFRDRGTVKLKAGRSKNVKIKYTPPDLESYRGDRSVVLRFKMPDGSPAAGKPVNIEFADAHYGGLPVFVGELPESGELTLENLSAPKPADLPFGQYAVSVGDRRLGPIKFSSDEGPTEQEFQLPPMVGDIAPNIDFVEIGTDRHVALADHRGKVVWLEFWATWCGPCQPAMQELSETFAKLGEEWGDRVAIVPLSIDVKSETVTPHVKEKGWDKLPQYWAERKEEEGAGFQAPASATFGVSGIPNAFLIGRDGRILWTGHPMDFSDGKHPADRIADALAL